ncbi:autotransporter domain-containing protein [Endothiovibrio diazotrophicus]
MATQPARPHHRPLLAAALLAALPATVLAERYVFLGDSLVDNQNSYLATALIEPNNVVPSSPPYWQGRFSNGPNWTDRLAPDQLSYIDYYFSAADCAAQNAGNQLAGLCGRTDDPGAQPASLSFAFGGSRAGSEELPNAPGMLTVINDLLGYDANDVVADLSGATFAILTGGNDYTNYVLDPGDVGEQQVVDQTLADIGTGIGWIAALQPKRVLVLNLFDLDRVPTLVAFFDDTQTASVGRLSALHNAGLPATLAAARAATGLDIVLVDLAALYDDIGANPARYGFTNLTGSCLKTDGSGEATGDCSDDESTDATLFWDGQHPTTAAHAYIADLVSATVRAVDVGGAQLTALGDSALEQARNLNATLRDPLDGPFAATGGTRAERRDGNRRYFLVAGGGNGRRSAGDDFGGYRYDDRLLAAGVAFRPDAYHHQLELGAHLGHLALDADLYGGGSFDNRALAVGGFARWQRDRLTLTARASLLDFTLDDLERPTGFPVLPTARGKTDGWGIGAELEARLEHPAERGGRPFHLATFGRLDANWARLGGFRERDAAFLDLAVERSELGELRAGLGVEAWWERPTASGVVRPALRAALEYDLLDDRRSLDATLSSGQRVSAAGEAPGRAALDLSAGLGYANRKGLRAELALAARLGSGGERLRLAPRLTVSQSF